MIRDFHNEYSGLFIRKYAGFFELPSDPHREAVVQISRGHRKTDLTDESEYPVALAVPDGETICLPYLVALVRLADEIDVTAARNPILMYDIESIMGEVSVIEHKKHKAVRELEITDDAFTVVYDDSDPSMNEKIDIMASKMQGTLDQCRKAVNGRTRFEITQREVRLRPLSADS